MVYSFGSKAVKCLSTVTATPPPHLYMIVGGVSLILMALQFYPVTKVDLNKHVIKFLPGLGGRAS